MSETLTGHDRPSRWPGILFIVGLLVVIAGLFLWNFSYTFTISEAEVQRMAAEGVTKFNAKDPDKQVDHFAIDLEGSQAFIEVAGSGKYRGYILAGAAAGNGVPEVIGGQAFFHPEQLDLQSMTVDDKDPVEALSEATDAVAENTEGVVGSIADKVADSETATRILGRLGIGKEEIDVANEAVQGVVEESGEIIKEKIALYENEVQKFLEVRAAALLEDMVLYDIADHEHGGMINAVLDEVRVVDSELAITVSGKGIVRTILGFVLLISFVVGIIVFAARGGFTVLEVLFAPLSIFSMFN